MANSRQSLRQQGNVVSLAEAREKRDAARLQKAEAPEVSEENLALRTLEEVTASFKADASNTSSLSKKPEVASPAETTAVQTDSVDVEESNGDVQASSADAETKAVEADKKQGLEATVESSKKNKSAKPRKISNRTYNKEKVDAIKKSIANGTYQINYQNVADRFIEREAQL